MRSSTLKAIPLVVVYQRMPYPCYGKKACVSIEIDCVSIKIND